MTVYYLRSVNPLGTPITTRHYAPDKAEAERGRRIAAGHTEVALQVAVIRNDTEIAERVARPGLNSEAAHA